jgi:hypothetical protein
LARQRARTPRHRDAHFHHRENLGEPKRLIEMPKPALQKLRKRLATAFPNARVTRIIQPYGPMGNRTVGLQLSFHTRNAFKKNWRRLARYMRSVHGELAAKGHITTNAPVYVFTHGRNACVSTIGPTPEYGCLKSRIEMEKLQRSNGLE